MNLLLSFIKQDIKRSFISWRFVGSVLAVFLLYSLSSISEMVLVGREASVIYIFDAVNSFNSLMDIFLVISVICYGTSYCEDHQSRYDLYLMTRINSRQYAIGRVLTCWLTTIIAVFAGTWLYILCLRTIYPWVNESFDYASYLTFSDPKLLNHPIVYLLYLTFIRMLAAGMWSIAALACSTIVSSTFVTIATPLLLNRVYSVIYWIFSLPSWLSIDFLTDSSAAFKNWADALLHTCSFFLIATFLFGVLFFLRVSRVVKKSA